MRYMIGRLRSHGCADSELEVKLFGGADTLSSKKENTIGSMNVKMALDIIRRSISGSSLLMWETPLDERSFS